MYFPCSLGTPGGLPGQGQSMGPAGRSQEPGAHLLGVVRGRQDGEETTQVRGGAPAAAIPHAQHEKT